MSAEINNFFDFYESALLKIRTDCQFRIMGQMIALRHGRNDIQAFEKVMTLSKAEIIDNPEPASRIIEAFN